jgi:hypothetical protein
MLNMRGGGYGKAVTLSLGCSARAFEEAAENRAIVPTMRNRILKSKASDCSGAFALARYGRPSKECQYLPPLFGATLLLSVPEPTLP